MSEVYESVTAGNATKEEMDEIKNAVFAGLQETVRQQRDQIYDLQEELAQYQSAEHKLDTAMLVVQVVFAAVVVAFVAAFAAGVVCMAVA